MWRGKISLSIPLSHYFLNISKIDLYFIAGFSEVCILFSYILFSHYRLMTVSTRTLLGNWCKAKGSRNYQSFVWKYLGKKKILALHVLKDATWWHLNLLFVCRSFKMFLFTPFTITHWETSCGNLALDSGQNSCIHQS